MAYWLVKTEPQSWSWDQQVAEGMTPWDGVRNAQAANNMKAMRDGDRAFFYHSGKERAIVGVVEIVKEYYPDPTDPSGRFGMVDVKTVGPMSHPVPLSQIKSDGRLDHLPLIRQSRLSVMPIDEEAWTILCGMGGIEA